MRRLIWIFSGRTCLYVRFLPFRLIIVMQLLKCFMRQLWKYNHSLLEQIGRQGRNFNNNDIWESNLIFHASDSYSHYWQKKKIAKSLVIFFPMEFWFPVCIASETSDDSSRHEYNQVAYMYRDGFVIIGVYADFNTQSVIWNCCGRQPYFLFSDEIRLDISCESTAEHPECSLILTLKVSFKIVYAIPRCTFENKVGSDNESFVLILTLNAPFKSVTDNISKWYLFFIFQRKWGSTFHMTCQTFFIIKAEDSQECSLCK